MPADRLLITLLRNLQTHTDHQDTPRLLSTASSLLTTLSNPNNLTLLTAQLLSANALWTRPSGLRTCLRFLGTFQAAAMAILRHEDEVAEDPTASVTIPGQPVVGGNLSRDEWVKAVISGADERSHRWKHLLVIAGLLIGYEGQERQGLSRSLRNTVGSALVKAVNLALEDVTGDEDLGAHCIVLVLNYSFELLSDAERAVIDYDRLLPVLISSAFLSNEGYRSGYFVASLEPDVVQVSDGKFSWSDRSPSFQQISDMSSQPLLVTMGPLARLIAHTAENLQDPFLIQPMMDDIVQFSNTLMIQWRHTKVSEVDSHEESIYFDENTLTKTLPIVWKLLRSALFATAIVLRGVIGRVLSDGQLTYRDSGLSSSGLLHELACLLAYVVTPTIAIQVLNTLRSLYFISSRLGDNSFSQYTFVYLSSIDILTSYPAHAIPFIESIRPTSLGQIPPHPLDRTLDLYFLNTSEHFTLMLSPQQNQDLLIAAATPYLASRPTFPTHLLEIFEAAHSVTLAVLTAPKSTESGLAAQHLPFYVGALFSVFPQSLSGRQFRLAYRSLARIINPPSPLSASHPDLAETLLELLFERASSGLKAPHRPAPYTAAGPEITPDQSASVPHSTRPSTTPADDQNIGDASTDERTTLVLALIDCLPFLSPHLLLEWLPRAAELIQKVDTEDGKRTCRERFWQALSQGEMDVERSRLCVGWWGTAGGREMVLGFSGVRRGGPGSGEHFMSGALVDASEVEDGESKL